MAFLAFSYTASPSRRFCLSLQSFRIPAWAPVHDAMYVAQLMGMKLATNEFVAMLDLKENLKSLPPHTVAVATTFLTSFANFSTVGMIYGTYNSILDGEKSTVIGKNVWKLLVSGIAVSLLSLCDCRPVCVVETLSHIPLRIWLF